MLIAAVLCAASVVVLESEEAEEGVTKKAVLNLGKTDPASTSL